MKLSVSNVLSILFSVLFMALMVCVLNVYTYINKANDYHETTIAEIEASNFSQAVIDSYVNNENSSGFKTEITDKTAQFNKDENLERTGRICEVKTTYTIKIPIIQYEVTKTIQGFAR